MWFRMGEVPGQAFSFRPAQGGQWTLSQILPPRPIAEGNPFRESKRGSPI